MITDEFFICPNCGELTLLEKFAGYDYVMCDECGLTMWKDEYECEVQTRDMEERFRSMQLSRN